MGCFSYKLYRLFQTQHSFGVTIFTLGFLFISSSIGFRLFFYPAANKLHRLHLLEEQFLSALHVHVDMAIANAILKKGTQGSFQLWGQDDHDLAVTVIQKPHALGGFGLTPNVIAQTSAKVAMASRFLGLFGSLP